MLEQSSRVVYELNIGFVLEVFPTSYKYFLYFFYMVFKIFDRFLNSPGRFPIVSYFVSGIEKRWLEKSSNFSGRGKR